MHNFLQVWDYFLKVWRGEKKFIRRSLDVWAANTLVGACLIVMGNAALETWQGNLPMMVPMHSQSWDSRSGELRPDFAFSQWNVFRASTYFPCLAPSSSVKWGAGVAPFHSKMQCCDFTSYYMAAHQQLALRQPLRPSSQSPVSCCPEEVSDWCGAASFDSLVTLAWFNSPQAGELVSLTCRTPGRECNRV